MPDLEQPKPKLIQRKPQERTPPTKSALEWEAINVPLKPNPALNRAVRMGAPTEDEELLKKPSPADQQQDFTPSDTWRVLRIMGEFVNGFDTLASLGAAVTVFGSARIQR